MHMTQLCSSDTHLLALLLDDLLSFWKFITCHPLQCAYLLFFSPYILQLLSFLSPLLLSTSLLLLVLLTVSPPFDDRELLPGSACRMVVDILKAKLEGNSTTSLLDQFITSMFLAPICDDDNSPACFFGESECIDTPNVFVLEEKSQEENPLLDQCLDIVDQKDEEDSFRSRHKSSRSFQRGDSLKLVSEGLQRDGSMRKEKEWKRTLACKLYEERMTFKLYEERKVVDGCEEMDLLWEAYEADSSKSDKSKHKDVKGKKIVSKEDEQEDDYDDSDDEESVAHFCCLQALKLSTGKMNLGMRRPNLVKFSNAMKGMGFFRRARKHSLRKG
ncbi:hypothetical protein J5N97_019830 [Dioscorea zingiberensis]|uniref:Uncharacterized protein n=1 Tax=Dioscorea zingiberensis TaxID=325984 RepID=A0A9D5CEL7_9LILI|nr:hypothetical protein J5N97_019830 [Dioscorea zingiberensis]